MAPALDSSRGRRLDLDEGSFASTANMLINLVDDHVA
jgi:hypothetical protein